MTIDLRDITGLFYGPPDAAGVRQVYMQVRGGMAFRRTEPEIPQNRDGCKSEQPEPGLYRAYSWMAIDHLPPGCVSIVDGPIIEEIP